MKISKQQKSIVVVGNFNPAIVTPDWLRENKLITNGDFNKKNIELINNEFSIFKIPDMSIFVSRERLQLSSTRYEVSELLFDLCKGIMELLKHTPVTRLGINQQHTYSLNTVDDRNELGYKLVPPDIWREVLPSYQGMNLLRIQANRTDGYEGYRRIQVEPSDENEVKFSLNDHFDLSGGTKELTKIIMEQSKPDSFFEDICKHILTFNKS